MSVDEVTRKEMKRWKKVLYPDEFDSQRFLKWLAKRPRSAGSCTATVRWAVALVVGVLWHALNRAWARSLPYFLILFVSDLLWSPANSPFDFIAILGREPLRPFLMTITPFLALTMWAQVWWASRRAGPP